MSNAVHISLNVSDLSRSADFYRRFFGEPRKLKSDYAKFVTEDPVIHLSLMPAPVRIGDGALSHLGIRVETSDAVRAWRKALVERGLPDEIPEFTFRADGSAVHLPALLADAFAVSRSDARRTVAQGGVRLGDDPVADLDVPAERLDGQVLRMGKRRYVRLRRAD